MKLNNLNHALLVLFFLLFFSVPGITKAESVNRVVAVVNDELVTLHELNKKMLELTGVNPEDMRLQSEQRFLETRRQVLDRIINEKITQIKVEELGINVSQKQLDETIERIKANNQMTHEQLLAALEKRGLPYSAYRENLRKEIERSRLINQQVKSKIIIREENIKKYFEEHISDFGKEGKIRIAGLFLVRKDPNNSEELSQLEKKGQKILDELKKGADFVQMVEQYSEGPGADEGGDLGSFSISQLEPGLRKMLEGMKAGDYTELIIKPVGVQIIKITEKQDGGTKTLDNARDRIYDLLYKEEVDRRYSSWLKELKEKSYIKIIF